MDSRLTVKIGADVEGLRRELQKATGTLESFSNQMKGVAANIGLAFGSTAVFQGLRYGIGVIQDFEKRMSEVRAITNASDEEFKKLRDSALELAKATKFSAEEVGQLQVEFGRLGFSTKEILDATSATLQLATATGEDLAKSADIAGSTLRAFNLDASEMQRVVDVMAASFNKSALGLDNFGEAIKYVAPVAAAANISLEETTSMLGVLADAGIRGSMAGTSLRKIISDVGGETGTLTERLQKLADKGLTGADAMDEVGRTAYASLLVLTKHVDKVNEATTAYQGANGEAQKMADLMGDNLAGDVKKLSSAFDAAIISGSGISNALRNVVQSVTDLINLLNSSGFVKGVIGGLDAIIKQGMIIPTVVKAIRDYNQANKEVAITAEENQNIINEVWGTPEDIKKTTDALNKHTSAIVTQASAYTKFHQTASKTDSVSAPSLTGKESTGFSVGALGVNVSEQVKTALQSINTDLINNKLSFDAWLSQVQASLQLAAESTVDFTGIIHSAISGIGHALGSAISGSTNLGDALLKVLGGVLVQLGEMLITAGLGVEAFKASLKSLNGAVAIAAGVALIAIGSAVAGSIKSLGSSTGSGSITATSRGFDGSSRSSFANGDVQDKVIVSDTLIRGQDLYIVYKNYVDNNKYTRSANG